MSCRCSRFLFLRVFHTKSYVVLIFGSVVREDLVGFVDLLEDFRLFAFIHIRMMLLGQPNISNFNFLIGGCFSNPQDLVVVFLLVELGGAEKIAECGLFHHQESLI